MTKPTRVMTMLIAFGLLAGCAGATTQARPERGATNLLTQEQLSATNSANLYDAIVRLRPSWLTSRGATSLTDLAPASVNVFMNGTPLGNADYLRQLRILDVTEVRYWDAGSATVRFGTGHPRGVIEITRK